MFDCKLPCGELSYVTIEDDSFVIKEDVPTFYLCDIDAPLSMDCPILQIRYNGRTVAPVGTFTGVFYMAELVEALKLGYKVKVKAGYIFGKYEILFKEYVDQMYSLRLQYNKDNPMNIIAKLLLNCLYGRFGMSDYFSATQILNEKNMFNYSQ